jgi:hypothetical protein
MLMQLVAGSDRQDYQPRNEGQRVTTANGNAGTYEMVQIALIKVIIIRNARGSMERAFNGAVGWEKTAQGVRGWAVWIWRTSSSQCGVRNLKLKEQYTTLRMAGRDRIGDRATIVVLGTTPEKKRERLFFDAETGLLLRRISYLETMIGVIPQQIDFEDYRDVEGVKLPFMVRLSIVDVANPYGTRKITEIKLNAPVDESKFKMPKPATP